MLLNVLENAVKFSAHGDSIKVKISGEIMDDLPDAPAFSNIRTLLSVIVLDRGIGFKESDHEKLFKPFIRLKDS